MELLEDGRGDHVYVPPGKSTELLNVVLEPIQMVFSANWEKGMCHLKQSKHFLNQKAMMDG